MDFFLIAMSLKLGQQVTIIILSEKRMSIVILVSHVIQDYQKSGNSPKLCCPQIIFVHELHEFHKPLVR
jgi:hypothetical protein